jgi:hypothetical protein
MDTPVKYRRFKWFGWPVVIIVLLLVAIRIALPYVILHFANQKLARLDGYHGHIRDIDLALYRGAYVINDIYIDKVTEGQKERTPFFSAQRIDLSVQWKALFEKKIVGEVEFEYPVLQYTMNKTVGKKAEDDTTDFIELVKDFMPLKINRFAVIKGEVHYKDPYSTPDVDVPLTNVNIEGLGLTNESASNNLLPASIDMTASLYDGNLGAGVKLDPLAAQPTFDLNGELSKTNLVYLNPFFTAYGNFDLKSGNMGLYTEFAAKQGGFKGYVKPLIRDLDIVQFNKEEGSPLQITWEAFVGSVAEVFQNQRKGTLATKVELEGKFSKPNVRIFDAIISVLKNAFIEALKPSLDHSVDIANVIEPEKDRKVLGIFPQKGREQKEKKK